VNESTSSTCSFGERKSSCQSTRFSVKTRRFSQQRDEEAQRFAQEKAQLAVLKKKATLKSKTIRAKKIESPQEIQRIR
jgi:hypothetical protein